MLRFELMACKKLADAVKIGFLISDTFMEVFNLHQVSIASDVIEQQKKLLFAQITKDIVEKGYSVQPNALPVELSRMLQEQVLSISNSDFVDAGIGRQRQRINNDFVRRDEICWITGSSAAGKAWLEWTADLQTYLNKQLLLGLFSFESHFAHYAKGAFYKRHLDAFKGEANRVLSIVAYLNPDWQLSDGGELVLFQNQLDAQGLKVVPALGTIAIFLSEEFPHEVLPAKRDRYSIAGWYRVNSSKANRVDPPR